MPLVQNPSIGPGAAPMLTTTTLLTAAQIVTLNSVPVNILPSPGAGKLLVAIEVIYVFKFGTVPFNPAASESIVIEYSPSTDGFTQGGLSGLVNQATSGFASQPGYSNGVNSILPGDDDSGVVLTAVSDYTDGPILTATLGAGGLGYLANDTGTITNGANDATYKVLTVGAGGAVLTFQITGAGTVCSVANGNATVDGGAQPGVGVGFTVNITAVQTGDGTLKVVTYYQIIPVP